METPEWLITAGATITSSLGSIFGYKKLKDKSQDAKIKAHGQEIKTLKSKVSELENKMEMNTMKDEHLRSDFSEHKDRVNKSFQDVKSDIKDLKTWQDEKLEKQADQLVKIRELIMDLKIK